MLNLTELEKQFIADFTVVSDFLNTLAHEVNSAVELMVHELELFTKYGCDPKLKIKQAASDGVVPDSYQLSLELENRSFMIEGVYQQYWTDPSKIRASVNGEYSGLIDLTADNIAKHFLSPDTNKFHEKTDIMVEFVDLVWEHFHKN